MADALRALAPKAAPLRAVRLGPRRTVVERRGDGSILLRSPDPLPPYPPRLTDMLEHWAKAAPDRIFLAQRDPAGAWRSLTYAEVLGQVRRIATALLARRLSAERPIAILSGNDIEHALLGLGAVYAGIPYAPISPAYAMLSTDFGKLKAIMQVLTPGLVFTSDGGLFARAIAASVPAGAELVVARNPPADRQATAFADLAAAPDEAALAAAQAAIGPDSIAKILFTSGSTGHPKGVINTHRMLCANQAMLRYGLAFVTEEPPVTVDWLPWNHTFGGNHNFNLVLFNGGSLFIDEGKPLPAGIGATVRNLREAAPTIYFNVPKGFEALLPHLRADQALRETFFSRLKVLFYAGAGLAQWVWDAYDELAQETCGERIIFLSSLGSTETAPLALACTWAFERPGNIGLPAPGVELKLVPNEGKLEARLRGPNITPGYWREAQLTAAAFDEEGYYRLGDTMRFVDAADPEQGLLFDGRIAEDFKLATGVWVNVGALRTAVIDQCAPYVRDVVIAGPDRDDIAVLIFPDIEALRALCPDLPSNAGASALCDDARVGEEFRRLLTALAKRAAGSSHRVARAILLADPPSMDAGEMTDKGSINQRAVLRHRADLVEELYAMAPGPRVIAVEPQT